MDTLNNQTELAEPASSELKLDLACGQSCAPGFVGVDLYPNEGVKHVVNLKRFPWPFLDNSVSEIRCSHFIEHLEMVYWGILPDGKQGYKVVQDHPEDEDLFLRFFDECYRILKPEGKMTVICPAVQSDRAWQDSTHRRFLTGNSFLYLSEDFRKAEKLQHYLNCKCCFVPDVQAAKNGDPEINRFMTGRTPEVMKRFTQMYRNVITDYVTFLTARK